jgi:hypothetical protein
LDLELTPDITLIAYLRWWTDVELVEQVDDGLITATTRKAYVGQVNNHFVCYPEWGSLRGLSGAKVRNWQTWLRANDRTANTAQGRARGAQDRVDEGVEVRADADEPSAAGRSAEGPAPASR